MAVDSARVGATEALLEFVRTYDDREAFDALREEGGLASYRDAFGPAVLAFTVERELEARAQLVAHAAAGETERPAEHRWGAAPGMRVALKLFDPNSCRRLAMVGCGPFPDSLLCLHDETVVPELVGFDRDPASAAAAAELVRTLGLGRISIERADARELDYSGFDAVCCSVFAEPRAAILARAAQTADAGTVVLVREPFFTGRLLFESVLDESPDGLEPLAHASGRGPFMLGYHALRVRPRQGTTGP